jgi:hypothetical protein
VINGGVCTCKHPASEHSEIEGLDGRGHCKVPGCDCGAFVAVGTSPPPQGARHTLYARATDASGEKGIQLIAAGGPGPASAVPEPVAMEMGLEAKRHYQAAFGEEPEFVGVAGLPYMEKEDKDPMQGKPAQAGIEMDPDADLSDAMDVLKEGMPLLSMVPAEELRPRDRLAVALLEVDKELAARTLLNEFADQGSLVSLALQLTEIGSDPALSIANRIRSGEFDQEPEGGS